MNITWQALAVCFVTYHDACIWSCWALSIGQATCHSSCPVRHLAINLLVHLVLYAFGDVSVEAHVPAGSTVLVLTALHAHMDHDTRHAMENDLKLLAGASLLGCAACLLLQPAVQRI